VSQRQGLLFAIIGPPGVGKNELMRDALARLPDLHQLATATTRPRRSNEQHGRERLFVTEEQFSQMIADGDLLEWQQVHGNRYGVPRETVEAAFAAGRDLTADIDVLGATYIRSLYPDNVILIFVQPPSMAELARRMRARGEDTEAQIKTRLKRVQMELTYAPICDYRIINDDFDTAAAELRAIITEARTRSGRSTGPTFDLTATIIPLYGDEVLCRALPPHYPTAPVPHGAIPHVTALDALTAALPVDARADHLLLSMPHRGSFIPPLAVANRGSEHAIELTYVYILPGHIDPPPGWDWVSLDRAALSPAIREALEEQREDWLTHPKD
jgi:guanylate kinase